MRIWIDADACPSAIKEIIFRAAIRTNTKVVMVANKNINVPINGLISTIRVSKGFDIADKEIEKEMSHGDLVITADIPLADAVIEKGGHALNPRGEMYTKDNIKDRLSMRNLLTELRDNGMIAGGPKSLALKDRQNFANQLDKFLALKHCG